MRPAVAVAASSADHDRGWRGEEALRLVAEYADSCNIFGTPAEVAAKLDVLRAHCETEGRDYATIAPTVMSVKDPSDELKGFLAEMEVYAELG